LIVVSDTSPLNYLILINAIEVLPALFGAVHMPPTIVAELSHDRAPHQVKIWAAALPEWVKVIVPTTQLKTATRIDPGEAQAIALAKELRADLLLIDERKGRQVAQDHGLISIGTVTVLELAAERDLLHLPTALNQLRETTFYVTQSIIDAALERHSRQSSPESI
jgi:predicted nucleic acid-binding protein